MLNSTQTSQIEELESEPIQHQINKRKQLIEQLSVLVGGAHNADIWLNSPHPVLGGRTPKSYIDEGKLEVLEYFIHAIETGQPS